MRPSKLTTGNSNTAVALTRSKTRPVQITSPWARAAGVAALAGNNNIHIGNGGANADTETIRIGFQGTERQTFIAGIRGATTGIDAVNVLIDSNGQLGTMNSSRRFKHKITAMESASQSILR